jgi:hypothetical protein
MVGPPSANYKPKVYNLENSAMTKPQHVHSSSGQIAPPEHQQNTLGTLARLFWLLLGNAALVFIALALFQRHAPFTHFSLLDLFYWIVAAMVIAARYCDIKYLDGLNGQGQPASMSDWRKYVILVLSLSAATWLAARAGGVLFR